VSLHPFEVFIRGKNGKHTCLLYLSNSAVWYVLFSHHQELMDALQPGDRIITIGGIHGQIESMTEENIVLKVESGATLRMARNAVAYKQEISP
jgi:hypothetical protein